MGNVGLYDKHVLIFVAMNPGCTASNIMDMWEDLDEMILKRTLSGLISKGVLEYGPNGMKVTSIHTAKRAMVLDEKLYKECRAIFNPMVAAPHWPYDKPYKRPRRVRHIDMKFDLEVGDIRLLSRKITSLRRLQVTINKVKRTTGHQYRAIEKKIRGETRFLLLREE